MIIGDPYYGGIYLKCCTCGKTIDGVEVTRGFGDAKPPLRRDEGDKLHREAEKRGWAHRSGRDYCPDHVPGKRLATHPDAG